MSYPSERADTLEVYVHKTHALSGPAHHLYHALRWIEREKSGLCRTVFAGYRELSAEAAIDITSVKPALLALQTDGLIELTIGRPVKADKTATAIRRKTLDELKAKSMQGDDDARRLATALSSMAFAFGDRTICPTWTVGRTGRVCSSKPNIQGISTVDRLAGLKAGLRQGVVLVHADIRQAEPTIIKHMIGIPADRDLYRQYMNTTGCPRAEAKKAINALAYCRNTLACFNHWTVPAQEALRDYVHRLADYKRDLHAESRRTRAVTTFTGRTISAEKGIRIHPGRVMNWRVQGTVADVVNAACIRLLDCVSALVPLHDAIYAVLPTDKAGNVQAAIIAKAREVGLLLTVTTEVYHAG